MILSDILYEGEFYYLSDPSVLGTRVEGITSDSRRVSRGAVFVSLKGIHSNGAEYIGDSVKRGAFVVICEAPPIDRTVAFVLVNDARKSLASMLHRFWGRAGEQMRLFAVTGTNGKTSTCCYLREIFMQTGIKTGYIGTLKSYIGHDKISIGEYDDERMSTMTTPDPEQTYRILYEMKRSGVGCVVVEASSHALKLEKLSPLKFDAGIFTNFSPEHLDFHTDINEYLRAKCKLFDLSKRMLINSDDETCAKLYANDLPIITYGMASTARVRASNVFTNRCGGTSYTVHYDGASIPISIGGFGRISAYNSLAAIALALSEGVDARDVCAGVSKLDTIEGRLERLRLNDRYKDLTVIIDYAHTERALEELLRAVSEIKASGQRIVTMFGCGGDRDKSKRAPMGRCASKYSDLVVITDDNPRSEDPECIISDILSGIDKTKEYKIIKNRRKAIEFVIKNARKDDIILLVGKGHEEYEIINDQKTPFSEKKIVYELLEQQNAEG